MGRHWFKSVDSELKIRSWGKEDANVTIDNLLYGDEGDISFDGEEGNDQLYSEEGNDAQISWFGDDDVHVSIEQDDLTGEDRFIFYTPGDFIIQDFDTATDKIVFESESTGINNLDELLSYISDIEDTSEGTVVNFVDDIASITFVGLQSTDLSTDIVEFTSGV